MWRKGNWGVARDTEERKAKIVLSKEEGPRSLPAVPEELKFVTPVPFAGLL